MQKPQHTELIFFWVIFAAVGVLSYFVIAPYLTMIFLSTVLAIVLHRPNKWLTKKLKGKENLSATIMTLIVAICLLIPSIFLGAILTTEVVDAYNLITQSGGAFLVDITNSLNAFIFKIAPSSAFQIDLISVAGTTLQYISGNLNKVFMSVAEILFNVFLLMFALFYFLRDGDKLKEFALKWSPLSNKYTSDIFSRLGSATSAVVKGTILVSIAQGAAVSIGLAIFGVPGALIFGIAAAICSLIPFVGTAIVTIPAILYLIFQGSYISAFALTLWSVILIGNVDTVLHPMLLQKGLKLHPLVIILSVIGGIAFFGPIGFIAGPIVIALLFVLLDIYPSIAGGKEIPENTELI